MALKQHQNAEKGQADWTYSKWSLKAENGERQQKHMNLQQDKLAELEGSSAAATSSTASKITSSQENVTCLHLPRLSAYVNG